MIYKNLPTLRFNTYYSPQDYLPSEELVQAVNVALMLGQPLLLTGEAGTGKTQLAYHLAWQLGLGEPLKFETKSDSKAKDLFYWFDSLSFFHAGQTQKQTVRALDFFKFNALGLAILLTRPLEEIADLMPAIPHTIQHTKPCRSVVLIDEIDKAPRDFPNDILNEIEHLYFKVPELNITTLKADTALAPIIILSSNSEKHLPEAFLRRCVYHHVEFPTKEKLLAIVEKRLPSMLEQFKILTKPSDMEIEKAIDNFFQSEISATEKIQAIVEKRLPTILEQFKVSKENLDVNIEKAIDLFLQIRLLPLGKLPATAELLNWLIILHSYAKDGKAILKDKESLIHSLGCLIKRSDDFKIVTEWLSRKI